MNLFFYKACDLRLKRLNVTMMKQLFRLYTFSTSWVLELSNAVRMIISDFGKYDQLLTVPLSGVFDQSCSVMFGTL